MTLNPFEKRVDSGILDNPILREIKDLIVSKDIEKAETELKKINEKSPDYYLLEAAIYYNKGWFLDSKKSMERLKSLVRDDKEYYDYDNALSDITNTIQVKDDIDADNQKQQSNKKNRQKDDCCCICCNGCGEGCGECLPFICCDACCDGIDCG